MRRKRCGTGVRGVDFADMDKLRHAASCFGVLWVAAIVVVGVGCDDKRRHLTSDAVGFAAVEAPVPPDAGPAEVVRAFLSSLTEAQHVRERGLKTAESKAEYDQAMGRITSLAARHAVYENMIRQGGAGVPAGLTEEAALTIITESWISTVSYYVDGFLFETLAGIPANSNSAELMTAYIEAEPPEDRARLSKIEASDEIAHAKDADGRPIVYGSKAYVELVRSKTLAMEPAFNTPIRVRIAVKLRQENGSWRVSGVGLLPAPMPTSLPVFLQTPSNQTFSTTQP